MLFWWICGGESVLPVLLLRHLGSSPILSFLNFLPFVVKVTTEHWVQFPVLYSRLSLVIYFIHINKSYIYICQSQSPSSSSPIPSLVSFYTFVFYICVYISALQIRSSIPCSWRQWLILPKLFIEEPLDESERREWKSWLKIQHSEN